MQYLIMFLLDRAHLVVSNTKINAIYFHSDEVDTAMHCGANKFTCREGGCVNQIEVCDGTPDCSHTTEGFSSDEHNCGQLLLKILFLLF